MKRFPLLLTTTVALLGIGVFLSGAFGDESEFEKRVKEVAAKMEEINKQRRAKVKQVKKTDADWKKELTPEEYRILRQKGTERAFTGKYDDFFKKGVYKCAACGTVLFHSDHKYNSGCGWPAFHKAADKISVSEHLDTKFGWIRTEVTCTACGGHLGHVFNDGPLDKGGIRYCINSAALQFDRNIPAATKKSGDTASTAQKDQGKNTGQEKPVKKDKSSGKKPEK